MRSLTLSISLAALAGLGAFVTSGYSQPDYGAPPPPEASQQGDNGRFSPWLLSKIHQVNRMEIEMGHLAEERGSSQQVRDFGHQLVEDHRQADDHVQELAQRKGISLFDPQPRNDDERHDGEEMQRMGDELHDAHGERFDRLFARAMDMGHSQMIHLLESSQDRIHDPEIRRLVDHTLPVLHKHLHMAQDIERNFGGPRHQD